MSTPGSSGRRTETAGETLTRLLGILHEFKTSVPRVQAVLAKIAMVKVDVHTLQQTSPKPGLVLSA